MRLRWARLVDKGFGLQTCAIRKAASARFFWRSSARLPRVTDRRAAALRGSGSSRATCAISCSRTSTSTMQPDSMIFRRRRLLAKERHAALARKTWLDRQHREIVPRGSSESTAVARLGAHRRRRRRNFLLARPHGVRTFGRYFCGPSGRLRAGKLRHNFCAGNAQFLRCFSVGPRIPADGTTLARRGHERSNHSALDEKGHRAVRGAQSRRRRTAARRRVLRRSLAPCRQRAAGRSWRPSVVPISAPAAKNDLRSLALSACSRCSRHRFRRVAAVPRS